MELSQPMYTAHSDRKWFMGTQRQNSARRERYTGVSDEEDDDDDDDDEAAKR